jgi:hypothetical protein
MTHKKFTDTFLNTCANQEASDWLDAFLGNQNQVNSRFRALITANQVRDLRDFRIFVYNYRNNERPFIDNSWYQENPSDRVIDFPSMLFFTLSASDRTRIEIFRFSDMMRELRSAFVIPRNMNDMQILKYDTRIHGSFETLNEIRLGIALWCEQINFDELNQERIDFLRMDRTAFCRAIGFFSYALLILCTRYRKIIMAWREFCTQRGNIHLEPLDDLILPQIDSILQHLVYQLGMVRMDYEESILFTESEIGQTQTNLFISLFKLGSDKFHIKEYWKCSPFFKKKDDKDESSGDGASGSSSVPNQTTLNIQAKKTTTQTSKSNNKKSKSGQKTRNQALGWFLNFRFLTADIVWGWIALFDLACRDSGSQESTHINFYSAQYKAKILEISVAKHSAEYSSLLEKTQKIKNLNFDSNQCEGAILPILTDIDMNQMDSTISICQPKHSILLVSKKFYGCGSNRFMSLSLSETDFDFDFIKNFLINNVVLLGVVLSYYNLTISWFLWSFLFANANQRTKFAIGIRMMTSVVVLNNGSSPHSMLLGLLSAKLSQAFQIQPLRFENEKYLKKYHRIATSGTIAIVSYSLVKGLMEISCKTISTQLPAILLVMLTSNIVLAFLGSISGKNAVFKGYIFQDETMIINCLGISVTVIILLQNNVWIKLISFITIGGVLYIQNSRLLDEPTLNGKN